MINFAGSRAYTTFSRLIDTVGVHVTLFWIAPVIEIRHFTLRMKNTLLETRGPVIFPFVHQKGFQCSIGSARNPVTIRFVNPSTFFKISGSTAIPLVPCTSWFFGIYGGTRDGIDNTFPFTTTVSCSGRAICIALTPRFTPTFFTLHSSTICA